jgi:hypothetical protein
VNAIYERQLELAISRELKALPELTAPASLADRVLRLAERRAAASWYQRPWQGWPASLQWAGFALLVLSFFGICAAGWTVSQTQIVAWGIEWMRGWMSTIGAGVDGLVGLVSFVAMVLRTLGPGYLIASVLALGLAYALCVGLGAAYLRLAFVKR